MPATLRHGRKAWLEAEWEDTWADFDRRHAAPAMAPPAWPATEARIAQGPQARRPHSGAAPRRRSFQAAILGMALAVGTALAFLSTPLGVALEVMEAVASADGSRLAAHLDGASLRPRLQAALEAEAHPAGGEPFSAGAEQYLAAMAGEMADSLVARPDTLAGLLRARAGAAGHQGGTGAALAAAIGGLRPEGLRSMRLELGQAGASLTLAPAEAGPARWQVVSLALASE